MLRRVTLIVLVGAAVWLPACSSGSTTTRTVLADYNNDQVAGGYQSFFPRFISAHPGDTIKFRQAWTGDPHTVTLGKLVDAAAKPLLPYLKGQKSLTDQPPADVEEAFQKLPSFFDPDVNQTVAQPCYIATGDLPTNDKPCPKNEQREPEFHGNEQFFNSGFIHFAGVGGNQYSITLADDIKPGEYAFNCVVHGPQMTGTITVVPKSTDVGGQGRINDAAHKQLQRFNQKLQRLHDATAAKAKPAGVDILAGAAPQANSVDGYDDREFFPERFIAHVGQKVTWLISTEPAHTVSFDVPKYLPVIIVGKDGTVSGNPETTDPRNSAAAANYDGTAFLSSGASFEGAKRFSVTFTKPGTYPYACLLHPRMIGEVVVR
ncbi:MAG TPA: plastocyanin/azurin family copper-binding protein [Acidimicrobiales bacterium]|nr:plastocyanin/azurin family copper-binding protein [Acidimicrobiales bacterium]